MLNKDGVPRGSVNSEPFGLTIIRHVEVQPKRLCQLADMEVHVIT